MTDVLVIGGGAAGMMAALAAADQGAQVCLLERNPKVGRKLYITGKGRVQRDEPLRRGAGACQHPPKQPLSLRGHDPHTASVGGELL